MYDYAFFAGLIAGILSTLFASCIVLAIVFMIIRHYDK